MIFVLLAYSGLLVAIGLLGARRVRRSGDFYVASRSLPAPLLFSTFLAANLGAGSTVGVAGFAYVDGLSAWWWVASAGFGSLLLAFWIGPRIYRAACRYDLLTVGDYLEHRYDGRVRLITAGLLWLGSLAILAGQLIALGFILKVAAGIPTHWGIALGGIIVTIYFTAGGLLSTAWVNLVQVCVKAAGFGIALPWALTHAASWRDISDAAARHTSVNPDAYLSLSGIGAGGIAGYAIILVPAFFVSPGLLQKLYGARHESAIRRGVGLQGLALLLYSAFPVLLGMIAFTRYPDLENPELALPTLLSAGFPFWLGALMLAAIFSAEVSSADAVLFMLSTSFARDFYQKRLRPGAGDKALLRVTRITAAAAGLAGIAVALWLGSILKALLVFYSLLVVTLFVPLVAGLHSTRPKASAALASIAVAVPATLAVHLLTNGKGFGLITPVAAGILASALAFAATAAERTRDASV
ncbi:MAG: sodium:solute symporter family protein [Bryobacterales bacterium]|nr:sodium:solute symporter family protein [Bryobacterales bacterium]